MKKSVFLPVLTILAAALILFGAAFGLSGITAANAQADHIRLLKTLLPGSTEFTAEAYDGYAGNITVLVGVNNDGKVTGIVVDDLSETFGLGREALTDVDFLKQFLNSSGTFAVATQGADAFSGATGTEAAEGDTVDVDALTGATVTSKAVVRCVNAAVAYVTGADTESAATSWGG